MTERSFCYADGRMSESPDQTRTHRDTRRSIPRAAATKARRCRCCRAHVDSARRACTTTSPAAKTRWRTCCCNAPSRELNELAYRHLDRPAPWHQRMSGFVDGFAAYCENGTRNCLVAEFTATGRCGQIRRRVFRQQTNAWLRQLTAAFRRNRRFRKARAPTRERTARYALRRARRGAHGRRPKPFLQTVRRLSKAFAAERRAP